jgi:hypothetical protein
MGEPAILERISETLDEFEAKLPNLTVRGPNRRAL